MKLVEFKKVFGKCKTPIMEAGGRIDHAEDLVFWNGSQGALNAIRQLEGLAKNTNNLTIKWDGSPAVVFGRNPNGEFIFTDKSGFHAQGYDGRATNSADLKGMIKDRAKKNPSKTDSYKAYADKIVPIFNTVAKAIPNKFQGYFNGDMLYFATPDQSNGRYIFKPNVVEYSVDVKSELGKKIGQSKAGVVVHNMMSEQGRIMPIKDLDRYIQGRGLFVIPPTTVNKKVGVDTNALNKIKNVVSQNATLIDALLDKNKLASMKLTDLPKILYAYTNAKVDQGLQNLGSDFSRWLLTSAVSEPKKQKIIEYVKQNINGFVALWNTVSGIMNAKDNIITQLDTAPGDVQASINGRPGGDGYVLGGIKLVRRSGFTQANRAINKR